MCRKIESVTISRIIKMIDPDAFITQANVNGVYGQGFDELKVKMKTPDHSLIHQPEPKAARKDSTTQIPPKI